jgi:hypothetical protein
MIIFKILKLKKFATKFEVFFSEGSLHLYVPTSMGNVNAGKIKKSLQRSCTYCYAQTERNLPVLKMKLAALPPL